MGVADTSGHAVAALAAVVRRTAVAGMVTLLGAAILTAGALQDPDALAPEAGARLERKLIAILGHADLEASDARVTALSEDEINAYLKYQGAPQLPAGLTEPTLRISDGNQVSATAVVDLNLIREQRARGWLDPLQYLAGRLPIAVRGAIRSGDGAALVDIESVTVGGIPMPVQVLQELVRHYTRTAEHPQGTRLDEPIPLPYGITELRLSPGQAVVVQ